MKPKSVFLHIGLHKTGSTALQKFLRDNAELLRAKGCLYPLSGRPPRDSFMFGHHLLPWSLSRDKNLLPVWDKLAAELDTSTATRVIISSEEFEFVRRRDAIQSVLKRLPDCTVRLVCYLRRQDRLIESEYNQFVKDGGGFASIEEFAKRMQGRLNYLELLERWESVFGLSNIIVRVYEQEQLRGDLYADFLSAVGQRWEGEFTVPKRPINPSLDGRGLAMMLIFNRVIRDQRLLSELRQAVARHCQHPPFHETNMLSPDDREDILKGYRQQNAIVARRYLGRDDGRLFLGEKVSERRATGEATDAGKAELLRILREHAGTGGQQDGMDEALRAVAGL